MWDAASRVRYELSKRFFSLGSTVHAAAVVWAAVQWRTWAVPHCESNDAQETNRELQVPFQDLFSMINPVD